MLIYEKTPKTTIAFHKPSHKEKAAIFLMSTCQGRSQTSEQDKASLTRRSRELLGGYGGWGYGGLPLTPENFEN